MRQRHLGMVQPSARWLTCRQIQGWVGGVGSYIYDLLPFGRRQVASNAGRPGGGRLCLRDVVVVGRDMGALAIFDDPRLLPGFQPPHCCFFLNETSNRRGLEPRAFVLTGQYSVANLQPARTATCVCRGVATRRTRCTRAEWLMDASEPLAASLGPSGEEAFLPAGCLRLWSLPPLPPPKTVSRRTACVEE